jgi:hypothetical protein
MEHRRQWHCPSCDGVFETRTSTENHLATEHPSISTSLCGDLIDAASQHVQIVEDPQCLFCDDTEPWDQSTEATPRLGLPGSKNLSISANSFQRHVGRHLEQIALFAVPSTVQDTEIDEVNSTPSQGTYGEMDTTSRIGSIAVELDRDEDAGDRSSKDDITNRQIPASGTDDPMSSPSTLGQRVTDIAASQSSERPKFESHALSEDQRSWPALTASGNSPPPRHENSTPSIGSVSRPSSDTLRDRLAALEARAGPPDHSPARHSNTPPLATLGINSRTRSHSQVLQPSHPSAKPSLSLTGTPSEGEGQLDGHMQEMLSSERLDGREVNERTSSDHLGAMREVKPENILVDQNRDIVLDDFDVHPSFQSNPLKSDGPIPSDDMANKNATLEFSRDGVPLVGDIRRAKSHSVDDLADDHGDTGPEELMAQPESVIDKFGVFPETSPESMAARASASLEGTSLPPLPPHEPAHRVNRSGTAVYDLPPSLDMPRAIENERRSDSFERVSADQTTRRRGPGLVADTDQSQTIDEPPSKASPGLSRLPSLRHRRTDDAQDPAPQNVSPDTEDKSYADREAAREAARRQRALDEAIIRREEDTESLENAQLDRETDQYRRSVDPLHRLPDTLYPPRSTVDGSWLRDTRPPFSPSHPNARTPRTRTRFASSPPPPSRDTERQRGSGDEVTHQYHYPDNLAAASRDTSESIRKRGREVIERGRARAAMENKNAVEDREPSLHEYDDQTRVLEYQYVSEGPVRQEVRRRRDIDDSRRREQRRDEFFR